MTKYLFLIFSLASIMLMSTSALAENKLSASLFPTVVEPTDKSLKCIQPEDEMRRNHMNYILHERNETMYKGIRKEPGSLAACIDCHVEPAANGLIAGIDSDEHFCTACHRHAAVQIDCFQCHADRPQKYISRGDKPSLIQQLQQVLGSHDDLNEGVTQK